MCVITIYEKHEAKKVENKIGAKSLTMKIQVNSSVSLDGLYVTYSFSYSFLVSKSDW